MQFMHSSSKSANESNLSLMAEMIVILTTMMTITKSNSCTLPTCRFGFYDPYDKSNGFDRNDAKSMADAYLT